MWPFLRISGREVILAEKSCYTSQVGQRLFLLMALLAVVPPVIGVGAETDPRVAPIVRAIEARYHDAKTLKAVFLERYSDGRQGLQVESGTVYFSRPGRMRWEYESPEPKTFVSDGKTVWFYVPADHTVTRAPLKQAADWRTPLALLTGKAQLSRLCDKIEATSQSPGAPGDVVLLCLPRGEKHSHGSAGAADGESAAITDPGSDFDRVYLEVNPETGQLADVKVLQPGGIELEYRFGSWQENLPIPDVQFRFEAPPGVAIVDGAAPPDPAAP
jgi:outer membrane lipoprotein carrier protein